MPRIIKEYATRRHEILDAAQRLIYAKGYDQMTIQDILDDLGIAKGLFYYYFESKQAMLMALIDRMIEALDQQLVPIFHDPTLTAALEKLQSFFTTMIGWETEQKAFFLEIVPVLYHDDNLMVREKMRTTLLKLYTPRLTAIIHQGNEEKTWKTPYPGQAAELALLVFFGLKDTLAQRLMSQPDDLPTIETTIAAYTDTLEHILGLPSQTLQLADTQTLTIWLTHQKN